MTSVVCTDAAEQVEPLPLVVRIAEGRLDPQREQARRVHLDDGVGHPVRLRPHLVVARLRRTKLDAGVAMVGGTLVAFINACVANIML
ncbi:MAG: hypothetical protein HC777_02340 [Hyphomonadaceae bacterium]|nr:hypothetical protein [Hyphomonadaceae bacterium]